MKTNTHTAGLWLQIGALSDGHQDYNNQSAIYQCKRGVKRLGIEWEDMKGRNRLAYLVDARRICCSHLYSKGWTYDKIATTLGFTNHATALYHKNRTEDLLKFDSQFAKKYHRFMTA